MSNSLVLRWVVLFVCLLAAADGIAQENFSRHNWYFGNTPRGIRFSRSNNTPSLLNNKAIPFGTGGSAVASNPINGDLLFYTDGSQIFDITHTQMPNGGSLNVQANANQPVAISQRPGFPNQYYVFTNTASFTAVGDIYVATVDMTASGNESFPEPPIGNVTSKNVQITSLAGRSEAMITVPHSDGTRFWLITHLNGQDVFSATLIDGTGTFPAPVLSPGITGFPMSAANFSYHAATGKIAVSPQTATDNVAILNFDNTSGNITYDRHVLTSGVASTAGQAIYDTEWSPSGRFLYISVHGDAGAGVTADVLQFDMNAALGTSLVSVLDNKPIDRSFGLQIAPDTAIYHLYQVGGSFLVGRLTDTDSVGLAVTHTPDAFGGAINFNGRQFPSFLPRANNNFALSFIARGACANSPVSFFPRVSPAADSLLWDFGDGETSNEWSPIHTYTNGNNYNVSLTAFLNGQPSLPKDSTISINNFTLQLTLVQDTTACRCEFPPPIGNSCNGGPFSVTVRTQGGTAPLTFEWSNNDMGATLTPDSAGYYYVVVTDATGCSTHAGVNVREYNGTDQRANIWYFGRNAGIDFNQQPPVAIPNAQHPLPGPLDTPEGCSVISDRNGAVIFSTDGVFVYDRNDQVILDPSIFGPARIGGENGSTQSALIVPVPDDETLYYIFTTQQVHGSNTYELRYSLYDLKLQLPAGPGKLTNGDGGLVAHNQLLFTRSTERITSDGRWLIAHEYGNNSFRAYEISGAGISSPVISSLGSDHLLTEELNGQGYMKVNGDLLAVAFSTSGTSNFIEVFDFVDSTGVVSNFRSLNLNTTQGQVYGLEIVGNKILTTIKGSTTSFLREAYINFQNNPVLIPPGAASGPYTAELGAIQRGPNGVIYVAAINPANNSQALGVIALTADTLQLSGFNLTAFPLAAGTQSRLGLPNFVQRIFNGTPGPSMNITAFCGGTPTIFEGVGTDQIDNFLWTFGDGFTADSANVEHTYPIPPAGTTQDYNVTLRITNRCGLDTLLTETITISGPPPNPTFLPPGQQPTVCNGPLTLQALPANDPALSYLWSTGETTFTIEVDRRQSVSLTITNAAGCTSNRSLLIVDNRPVIELGPDQTVCEGTPVASFNAGNPSLVYQWEIDGVVQPNTTGIQPVNTSSPVTNPDPDFYRVRGTNTGNGCVGRDSVTITIYQIPDVTLTPTNPSACGINDGQLQVSITGPAPGTFEYSIFRSDGTLIDDGIDQSIPPAPVNILATGLSAATYTTTVTDQISGCSTISSAGLNNTSVTISATPQTPTCTAVPIIVTTNAGSGTYRVINSQTGQSLFEPPPAFTAPGPGFTFLTSPVTVPGEYIVEIRSGTCVVTTPVSVVPGFDTDIDFFYDVCAQPLMTIGITTSVVIPAGSRYTWSGDATAHVDPSNSANTTADPEDGLQTFTVTIDNPSDPTQCPVTESIQLFIARNITATISQNPANGCTDPVTISVTPSPAGNYTYNWTRTPAGGGSPVAFVGGQSIIATIADNGATYTVQAVNAVTGCVSDPVSIVALVSGEIVVFIDPVSPCQGDVFNIEATDITGATYQWFLNGNLIAGQNGATLTGQTQEGTYSVIATGSAGCPSDEVSGEIRFVPDPDGTLPSRRFICNRSENLDCAKEPPNTCEFQLVAGDGISWQWFKDGVEIAGATSQALIITEPGIYSVEVLNSFECINVDQTEVILQCEPLIDVPNAFRPGSQQELNRTFHIFPIFVSDKNFQIFIFNRWGEMVFQSNNRDFEWDGTYNGNKTQALPTGTYTYVIKYFGDLTSTGEQELRGGVLLLR